MRNVLGRAWPCTRIAVALGAIAMLAAGCAAANNATSSQASNQASGQGEQPYKTGYGLSSEGTTTDVYTEIFGARQSAPATTVATAQAVQPVAAQPIAPVQPGATAASPSRTGQPATTMPANRPNQPQTTSANRAPQPAFAQNAPAQAAQQPAAPPPPQEPDVPTAYGITANGPTTDVYTAIFGPRRSDGQ